MCYLSPLKYLQVIRSAISVENNRRIVGSAKMVSHWSMKTRRVKTWQATCSIYRGIAIIMKKVHFRSTQNPRFHDKFSDTKYIPVSHIQKSPKLFAISYPEPSSFMRNKSTQGSGYDWVICCSTLTGGRLLTLLGSFLNFSPFRAEYRFTIWVRDCTEFCACSE